MRTLSRKRANRSSLMRNLATSLLLYESMETTLAKAKEVKSFVDSLLPRAKSGDLNAVRYLNSVLFDKNAVDKVLKELNPRYADRASGFVKIYKTGNRLGDNASTARVELVDKKVFVEEIKKPAPKTTKKSDKTLKSTDVVEDADAVDKKSKSKTKKLIS